MAAKFQPLRYQEVEIPFSGGLDGKTAEKLVQPGQLLTVENGEFCRPGSVTKRDGTGEIGTTLAHAWDVDPDVETTTDHPWCPVRGGDFNGAAVLATSRCDVFVSSVEDGEWNVRGNCSNGTLDRRIPVFSGEATMHFDTVFNEHSGLHVSGVLKQRNDPDSESSPRRALWEVTDPNTGTILVSGEIEICPWTEDLRGSSQLKTVSAGKWVGIFYVLPSGLEIECTKIDMDSLDESVIGIAHAIPYSTEWDACGTEVNGTPMFAVSHFLTTEPEPEM